MFSIIRPTIGGYGPTVEVKIQCVTDSYTECVGVMKMKEENGDGRVIKISELSMPNTTPTPNNNSSTSAATSSNKRLLFDRRYGWVVDEWKNPSEEAFAGARGMFCIVPLAKSLLDLASYSINSVVNTAVEVLERPDRFRPQQLQATVGNQLQQLASSMQKPDFNLFKGKRAESSNLQELESV